MANIGDIDTIDTDDTDEFVNKYDDLDIPNDEILHDMGVRNLESKFNKKSNIRKILGHSGPWLITLIIVFLVLPTETSVSYMFFNKLLIEYLGLLVFILMGIFVGILISDLKNIDNKRFKVTICSVVAIILIPISAFTLFLWYFADNSYKAIKMDQTSGCIIYKHYYWNICESNEINTVKVCYNDKSWWLTSVLRYIKSDKLENNGKYVTYYLKTTNNKLINLNDPTDPSINFDYDIETGVETISNAEFDNVNNIVTITCNLDKGNDTTEYCKYAYSMIDGHRQK